MAIVNNIFAETFQTTKDFSFSQKDRLDITTTYNNKNYKIQDDVTKHKDKKQDSFEKSIDYSTKDQSNSDTNTIKANTTKIGNKKNNINKEIKDNSKKYSITKNKNDLSDREKRLISELERMDRAVKTHEAAHKAAGGGLVRGGATYSYTIGPDGKRYASSGEVKIDMSYNLSDPEATIQKMEQVKRAALAPIDPSAQDRAVAQQASTVENEARMIEQKEQAIEISKTMDSIHKSSKNNSYNSGKNYKGQIFNQYG